MMRKIRSGVLLLLTFLVAGCAVVPTQGPQPAPPVSENTAVVALVNTAHANLASGRLDTAEAALERALRIEPRNPALWHELAKLRLNQGQYQQAETFAKKSNAWAGGNRRLRAANWRVIGEARASLGERDVAQAAFDKAAELEK